MYLLDTNTLSYYFRGEGRVAQNLLVTPPQEVAISSVTLFELEYGLRRRPGHERAAQLQAFVNLINVVPLEVRTAKAAADIRIALDKAGSPIGPFDLLIAACALARQATLVTHNTREFERVPNLKLEDWY